VSTPVLQIVQGGRNADDRGRTELDGADCKYVCVSVHGDWRVVGGEESD